MARMSDDMQDWFDEIRDKKHTARSAKNRKYGGGRRGPAKLPSDYLTEKQLRAMNGEVATYRLGAPMNWTEFKAMPDDLKVVYIKKLRKLYNIPDIELALAMGVDISDFVKCLSEINLSVRTGTTEWYGTDECKRFRDWWIITKEEK